MLDITVSGSFSKTDKFLLAISRGEQYRSLERFAQEGVRVLQSATPVDSGLAARSWGYKIERSRGGAKITWTNSDTENGFPVAIMLQYGHGTGSGGYVQGRDYINPALRPVFDKIANEVWRVVTSS